MINTSKSLFACILLGITLMSGCASQRALDEQAQASNEMPQGDPRDPLEPLNRVAWNFNWEVLDQYILRP